MGLRIFEKEAEQQAKTGKVGRKAGRGGLPVASPRKLHQPLTKADLPRPFSCFQMTILAIC
jgi:hypothetical protein